MLQKPTAWQNGINPSGKKTTKLAIVTDVHNTKAIASFETLVRATPFVSGGGKAFCWAASL